MIMDTYKHGCTCAHTGKYRRAAQRLHLRHHLPSFGTIRHMRRWTLFAFQHIGILERRLCSIRLSATVRNDSSRELSMLSTRTKCIGEHSDIRIIIVTSDLLLQLVLKMAVFALGDCTLLLLFFPPLFRLLQLLLQLSHSVLVHSTCPTCARLDLLQLQT